MAAMFWSMQHTRQALVDSYTSARTKFMAETVVKLAFSLHPKLSAMGVTEMYIHGCALMRVDENK